MTVTLPAHSDWRVRNWSRVAWISSIAAISTRMSSISDLPSPRRKQGHRLLHSSGAGKGDAEPHDRQPLIRQLLDPFHPRSQVGISERQAAQLFHQLGQLAAIASS
jgi:hypothetical protein